MGERLDITIEGGHVYEVDDALYRSFCPECGKALEFEQDIFVTGEYCWSTGCCGRIYELRPMVEEVEAEVFEY